MKKIALVFLLSFFMAQGFSQSADASLPKMVGDTLYTSCGYKITAGQDIKLGTGSNLNGDFKYISASNSPFPHAPNARQVALHSSSNGHIAKVKKIKKEGSSKKGYVYRLALGTGDVINYECDIESAIAAGEIVVPDKYKSKAATSSTQPVSVADELTKLKKLYDDSVITKEEFEAQKKKLLDGNN
jgi:hypothetical protein